jgi:hypothetical protein
MKGAKIADLYGLLRNAFRADYVYCRDENIVGQMERDARFRRIHPRNPRRNLSDFTMFVYELAKEPPIDYVKGYELSFLEATPDNFSNLGPESAEKAVQRKELSYSGYLDLGAVFKERIDRQKDQAICARVVPDTASLVGATYLTLGGGRNIRLWRNGTPYYESDSAFQFAQMHQEVLPLDQPIRAGDKLEFVVCSGQNANYWGFSLAGLTEKSFREVCDWKRALELEAPASTAFAYGRIRQSCLGMISLPQLPRALR